MSRVFNAEEFAKRLAAGTLGNVLTLSGMAKPSGEDRDAILFCAGTSHLDWVCVPSAMIERVEWFGNAPIADQECERVDITLREPEGDDAQLLFNLLAASCKPANDGIADYSGLSTPHTVDSEGDLDMLEAWPPRLPGIHLPDPRRAWKKAAEKLARAAAGRIAASSNRSNCKSNVRTGLLALGGVIAATSGPSGQYMGLIVAGMGYLADDACPQ